MIGHVIEADPDQEGLVQKMTLDVWPSEPDTRRNNKSAVVNAGKASPQASPAAVRRSVKTGEFPWMSQERSFNLYSGPL